MGDDRSVRVGGAFTELIKSLTPRIDNESDASLEERRDDAHVLAKSIIDGLVTIPSLAGSRTNSSKPSKTFGSTGRRPHSRLNQARL